MLDNCHQTLIQLQKLRCYHIIKQYHLYRTTVKMWLSSWAHTVVMHKQVTNLRQLLLPSPGFTSTTTYYTHGSILKFDFYLHLCLLVSTPKRYTVGFSHLWCDKSLLQANYKVFNIYEWNRPIYSHISSKCIEELLLMNLKDIMLNKINQLQRTNNTRGLMYKRHLK